MGPNAATATARSAQLRLALAGTALPVLVAVATNGFSHRAPFLIGAVASCAAALGVSAMSRRFQLLFWLAEFGGIPALTLMQSYSGGVSSGYSVLAMMAMIWFGLQATRGELVIGAGLLAACSYLPMVVIGAPAYPVAWGHATMIVLVGCTVAATLQALKGETVRITSKLREEAVIDDLTGLLNRRGWRDMSSIEFQRAAHRGGTVALVTIDLDHFKALNDTHGHDHGDRALREAGRWMQASFRAQDIVARLGGDEFVVLLADVTLDGAMAALARLRDAPLRNQFSAGVAIWDGAEDLETLMRRSDRALYAAKSRGGRQTLVAAPLASPLRLVGARAS